MLTLSANIAAKVDVHTIQNSIKIAGILQTAAAVIVLTFQCIYCIIVYTTQEGGGSSDSDN